MGRVSPFGTSSCRLSNLRVHSPGRLVGTQVHQKRGLCTDCCAKIRKRQCSSRTSWVSYRDFYRISERLKASSCCCCSPKVRMDAWIFRRCWHSWQQIQLWQIRPCAWEENVDCSLKAASTPLVLQQVLLPPANSCRTPGQICRRRRKHSHLDGLHRLLWSPLHLRRGQTCVPRHRLWQQRQRRPGCPQVPCPPPRPDRLRQRQMLSPTPPLRRCCHPELQLQRQLLQVGSTWRWLCCECLNACSGFLQGMMLDPDTMC
mmetsp:Transcript_91938/g.297403  ORF Transcript_91938/g.297403 Transcript_91938/m.297403 type:complete len:259 (+) Transcript_91938:1958-2734(+)